MKKTLLATLLSCTVASQANAALTAYYSLDNLTTGIQNQGTDGASSNLSALDAGATPTVISGGIIGSGAMSFDGNDLLRNISAGNAGDDLAAYPFAMSIWVRNVTIDATRDAVFSVSDRAVAGTYYNLGVDGSSGTRAEPELIRRNTTFTELNATNVNVSGSTWTNVVTIFNTSGQIYINGKLVNSDAGGQTFGSSVNTISIGGFLRNNGTTPTDAYHGEADDAGLFDTALTAADVALINGLGKTGGIGLDQLDEAQALLALSTGSIAPIGGYNWERVTNLAGTTGDFGGTTAGGNAFIVTDALGNGIQVTAVPEPSSLLLAAAGIGIVAWKRRRRD